MTCKKIEILIPKYMEDSLSDNEKQIVEEHIKKCADCKYLYDNLVLSLQLLSKQEEIPEQAFYYTRLKQKMEAKSKSNISIIDQLFKIKIVQPIIYLSTIIIAVFIGIQIGSNSNDSNYSSIETKEKSFTEVFAESQYINDFEIEVIENNYFSSDTTVNE